jgi:hypothetical protein
MMKPTGTYEWPSSRGMSIGSLNRNGRSLCYNLRLAAISWYIHKGEVAHAYVIGLRSARFQRRDGLFLLETTHAGRKTRGG